MYLHVNAYVFRSRATDLGFEFRLKRTLYLLHIIKRVFAIFPVHKRSEIQTLLRLPNG